MNFTVVYMKLLLDRGAKKRRYNIISRVAQKHFLDPCFTYE